MPKRASCGSVTVRSVSTCGWVHPPRGGSRLGHGDYRGSLKLRAWRRRRRTPMSVSSFVMPVSVSCVGFFANGASWMIGSRK